MAHVERRSRQDTPDLEDRFASIEETFGFLPNSILTMSRVPGLVPAFQSLARAVIGSGLVPRPLGHMISFVTSNAGGCRYCQAHSVHSAERAGVDDEKLAALWDFETSDLFSRSERAALRLAFHAGQVPNAVTDEDFEECRKYYTEDQITGIVAICALFGYLNRWNDTMATDLEVEAAAVAKRVLTDGGWEPGKHG